MNNLQLLLHRLRQYLLIVLALENLVLIGSFWALAGPFGFSLLLSVLIALGIAVVMVPLMVFMISGYATAPVKALWQTILSLTAEQSGVEAPKNDDLKLGRELVTTLMSQVYQLADQAHHSVVDTQAQSQDIQHNFVAQNLPLPFLVLDNTETIKFANAAAADYIGIPEPDLIGKNVYMVLDMSFPSEDTFDVWLKDAKQRSATSVRSWERVKLNVRDNHPLRLFDLAAYYNKDNAQGLETMVVLFDHTKEYSQDDQAVSFIALSVHELRTPLTLLRGYIEVFEEELQGKVDAELVDFMFKMRATAQQLMAFVNNILNVARIEDDQLELTLQEEEWPPILREALDMLSLRAGVRGIQLQYSIAPGLPTVGVDRLSILEVLNNLVDNAIKYSAGAKVIKIDTHLTTDGMVETSVQDFGNGISPSILPNLFTKFYRDHRNRAQIGGTGLGLFLSKAIVTAHGGNIWVRSQEGQGSIFGFTLTPYARLTDELKQSSNHEITRSAHGWIKNHSLYRR